MLKFTFDPTCHAAGIYVSEAPGIRTVELVPGAVIAFLDEAGQLAHVELLNTRRFSADGFDEAAAVHAVRWVREQLETLAAS